MAQILVNSNYRISTIEIGLTTVNKQLFDNILATEKDNKVTVSFRVKQTLEEAAKWEITGNDTLNILLGQQTSHNALWVNWTKANDEIQKGFCIPIHNVEWLKYDNS